MRATLQGLCLTILVSLSLQLPVSTNDPTFRPVVIWHGLGDNCCLPFSMGAIKKEIETANPGIYVKSIMIGANPADDSKNGYLMPVDEQLRIAHEQISQDEKLKNGFNAVGFSQGSQFLRAYLQKYGAKMHNLVSVGGQHQGVFGMPRCLGENHTLCEEARRLLALGAYIPTVQNHLVPAEYWHDPFKIQEYKTRSVFLAEINNENTKNETYVANLKSLNKFVMVKFTLETVVQPKESEWFGFYKEGSDKEIETLQESALYKEDRLGLKEMDEAKQLVFLSCVGDHLQMPKGWFQENLMPYLSDKI